MKLRVGARCQELQLCHPPVVPVLREKEKQGLVGRVERNETNGR